MAKQRSQIFQTGKRIYVTPQIPPPPAGDGELIDDTIATLVDDTSAELIED